MSEETHAEKLDWRHGLLGSLTLFPVLALFLLVEPIAQPQEYHNFADARILFGIANFSDVFSNLVFLLVGVLGIRLCLSNDIGAARNAWLTMFVGLVILSFGSAYYHWSPSDETLVWDRVAMTIGFMGLFTGLLVEFVSARLIVLLVPLVTLGIASVFYGYYLQDLRLYVCVQFVPLLLIPIFIALFDGSHSHQKLLLIGLAWYALAKITEHFDVAMFQLTGEMISGHTAKHLLAAVSIYCILLMLKVRAPKSREAGSE